MAFEAADMATVVAPEEPYERLASRFGMAVANLMARRTKIRK